MPDTKLANHEATGNPAILYETAFSSVLDPGEVMLWAGQPVQGLAFHASDLWSLSLAFFFGAAGFAWTVLIFHLTGGFRIPGHLQFNTLISTAPIVVELPGLFCLLFSTGVFAGRLLLQPWERRRTHYGVTDKRAIVITNWHRPEVHTRDLKPLDFVDIRRHRDGTATFAFDCKAKVKRGLFGRGTDSRYVFDRTTDAGAAQAAIRQVRGE